MKLTVATMSLALAVTAVPAFAADVVSRPTVLPLQVVAAPYDWSGVYLGANIGYENETSTWNNIDYFGTHYTLHVASPGGSGWLGGGSIGVNRQVGAMVYGLEGTFDFAGINGSSTCLGQFGDYSATCESAVNWAGDVSAKLGYASGPSLFFVKGGLAFGKFTYNAVNLSSGDPNYNSSSDTRFGYLLGAGLDQAINNRVALTFEADYMNFGTRGVTFTPPFVGSINEPFATDITESTLLAKVGLTVKLQ